jgi:hypothetical protein
MEGHTLFPTGKHLGTGAAALGDIAVTLQGTFAHLLHRKDPSVFSSFLLLPKSTLQATIRMGNALNMAWAENRMFLVKHSDLVTLGSNLISVHRPQRFLARWVCPIDVAGVGMTLVETSHSEHGFTLPGFNEIFSLLACAVYIGESGAKVFLVGCSLARLLPSRPCSCRTMAGACTPQCRFPFRLGGLELICLILGTGKPKKRLWRKASSRR